MKRLSAMMTFLGWVLLPSVGYSDGPLGRLFYTPEQRARMDVARQHERNVRIDEEESLPQSATILLNGVITRSDGRSTVWINNRIQNETAPAATVVKGGEVRFVAPDAKQPVPLKVGQSFDTSSGQVEEIYRRAPPAPAPGKDTPSTATMPSATDASVPPSRQDSTLDAPADAQGEISHPR